MFAVCIYEILHVLIPEECCSVVFPLTAELKFVFFSLTNPSSPSHPRHRLIMGGLQDDKCHMKCMYFIIERLLHARKEKKKKHSLEAL